MTSPCALRPSTFRVVAPTDRLLQTGVSGAQGCAALNVCDLPSSESSVKRYEAAPGTAAKSSAGAQMNCLACSFQNGAWPGTPGRIGIIDSAIAKRCNSSGDAA